MQGFPQFAGPNERVTSFTGRASTVTSHKRHLGCVLLDPVPADMRNAPYDCLYTVGGHGNTHVVELSHLRISTFDFCIGGIHGVECREARSVIIVCNNVLLNGKPLDGTFIGQMPEGGDSILYIQQNPELNRVRVSRPLVAAGDRVGNWTVTTVILPYITALLCQERAARPHQRLVEIQALRSTCRGLWNDPRLIDASLRMYVVTRPRQMARYPPLLPLEGYERHGPSNMCLARGLMNGASVDTARPRHKARKFARIVSSFADLVEKLLISALFQEENSVAIFIPVKPCGIHAFHGFMYGMWTFGSEKKQFAERGWFHLKCFTWLEKFAQSFQDCGHGYSGVKTYYVELVRQAFREGGKDVPSGIQRVVARLERLGVLLRQRRCVIPIAYN